MQERVLLRNLQYNINICIILCLNRSTLLHSGDVEIKMKTN